MNLTYHQFTTLTENWRQIDRDQFAAVWENVHRWHDKGGGDMASVSGMAIMLVLGNVPPQCAVKLSDFDREHVDAIVCDREGSHFTNYSAHVLRLIKKADPYQRELLRMIYPDHVEALLKWESGDPAEATHGGR